MFALASAIGNEWWPLVGFGLFVGIILWVIVDLYKANKCLLDSKPSISVEPLREDNYVLFEGAK